MEKRALHHQPPKSSLRSGPSLGGFQEIICSKDLSVSYNTISKKLGYRLSPQPPDDRGALVDAYGTAFSLRCVAPVDRNGITL